MAVSMVVSSAELHAMDWWLHAMEWWWAIWWLQAWLFDDDEEWWWDDDEEWWWDDNKKGDDNEETVFVPLNVGGNTEWIYVSDARLNRSSKAAYDKEVLVD